MDRARIWHTRFASAAGLIAGLGTGIGIVILAGTAVAQRVVPGTPATLMEATHLPPLLTAGERVELRYDVYCAAPDTVPDRTCEATGTVFVRPGDTGPFQELAVREDRAASAGRFVVAVPAPIARSADGFTYYAVFRSDESGATAMLPAGGPAAPQRSLPLGRGIEVALGAHDFGHGRQGDARVAQAAWGDGPAQVGLEQGRNLSPIGGSAFDIEEDGAVVVLDEANRRLLRWRAEGATPEAVPLAVNGTLADMAVANDGTVYVLETTGEHAAKPVLRTFGPDGAPRGTSVVAERPSQVRVGPAGPIVLQNPSAQWTPAAVEGRPVPVSEQMGAGRPGRTLRDGREIVVLRTGNEVRVALVGAAGVQRAWLVRSETPLAEVQLAEPYGVGVVLVTRVYTDDRDEFVVLVLDRRGVARHLSLASADWAESAPLSRFRLAGDSLYQLGSTPAGLFVDRFDLEVH
jgi:hypothetical protein